MGLKKRSDEFTASAEGSSDPYVKQAAQSARDDYMVKFNEVKAESDKVHANDVRRRELAHRKSGMNYQEDKKNTQEFIDLGGTKFGDDASAARYKILSELPDQLKLQDEAQKELTKSTKLLAMTIEETAQALKAQNNQSTSTPLPTNTITK